MIVNKKNILYSYLSQIVSLFSGILLSVVLVRYLSVNEFGEYRLLNSIITILSIISSFGLDNIMQRYAREFLDRGKFGVLNNFLLFVVGLRIFILFIILCCILYFYPEFKEKFNLSINFFYFLLFLTIFFLLKLKSLIGTAFLTAYLEIYKEQFVMIITQIAKLILFSFIVYYGYGIEGILSSWVIIELLSVIYFVIIFLRKVFINKQKAFSIRMSFSDKKRIFEFAKYQTFAVILFSFADIAVDNIVIGYYLNQEQVAYYAFAMGLIMILSRFNPISLLKGLVSTIFVKKYIKNKNLQELKTYFVLISKLIMSIVIPIYFIFIVNIENIIIYIYSTKYLSSLPVIYIGALFFMLRELTYAFNPLINSLEKNKLFLYVGVFSIYNLIMDIILIPKFGIIGAIVATGSAGLFIFFFYYYQFLKVFTKSYYPWNSLIKVIILNLPILFIGIIINQYIDNLIYLFLSIIFESSVVYILYVKFKIFTQDERNILNGYINRTIIKF